VDPVLFVSVMVVRRMLFYLTLFHLGRSLGPHGIPWVEARAARFGRFVRWLERLFSRAPHAVVLLGTGPAVSALAGISGMRTALFTPLAIPGIALRAGVVLGLAQWLREPIEAILALIDEYWVPGTALLVTGIAIHRWRRRSGSAGAPPVSLSEGPLRG
jgi:membrane protein DedA with SNARE-associated domain